MRCGRSDPLPGGPESRFRPCSGGCRTQRAVHYGEFPLSAQALRAGRQGRDACLPGCRPTPPCAANRSDQPRAVCFDPPGQWAASLSQEAAGNPCRTSTASEGGSGCGLSPARGDAAVWLAVMRATSSTWRWPGALITVPMARPSEKNSADESSRITHTQQPRGSRLTPSPCAVCDGRDEQGCADALPTSRAAPPRGNAWPPSTRLPVPQGRWNATHTSGAPSNQEGVATCGYAVCRLGPAAACASANRAHAASTAAVCSTCGVYPPSGKTSGRTGPVIQAAAQRSWSRLPYGSFPPCRSRAGQTTSRSVSRSVHWPNHGASQVSVQVSSTQRARAP